MTDPRRLLLHIAVVAVGLGCAGGVGNDGDVVGGTCADETECASGSRCLRGDDYPEGTCSVVCEDDVDCPADTACVDTMGGVCLLLCNFDEDCRSGYGCDDRSRQGAAGSATVCID